MKYFDDVASFLHFLTLKIYNSFVEILLEVMNVLMERLEQLKVNSTTILRNEQITNLFEGFNVKFGDDTEIIGLITGDLTLYMVVFFS